MNRIIEPLQSFLSLIFPELCLICGREFFHSSYDFPLCSACLDSLKPLSGILCEKCGYRLLSENLICTRCRTSDYSFDSNNSLFEYSGTIKELIYQYKFRGRKRLSYFFATVAARKLQEKYTGYTLIPVPSSKKSKKKRGWDHMKAIAEILKNRFHIPVIDGLVRHSDIQQKELNYEERLSNIRGKIYTNKKLIGNVSDRIVLFDDVFTTGATASECARVLKTWGIKEVRVLTITID